MASKSDFDKESEVWNLIGARILQVFRPLTSLGKKKLVALTDPEKLAEALATRNNNIAKAVVTVMRNAIHVFTTKRFLDGEAAADLLRKLQLRSDITYNSVEVNADDFIGGGRFDLLFNRKKHVDALKKKRQLNEDSLKTGIEELLNDPLYASLSAQFISIASKYSPKGSKLPKDVADLYPVYDGTGTVVWFGRDHNVRSFMYDISNLYRVLLTTIAHDDTVCQRFEAILEEMIRRIEAAQKGGGWKTKQDELVSAKMGVVQSEQTVNDRMNAIYTQILTIVGYTISGLILLFVSSTPFTAPALGIAVATAIIVYNIYQIWNERKKQLWFANIIENHAIDPYDVIDDSKIQDANKKYGIIKAQSIHEMKLALEKLKPLLLKSVQNPNWSFLRRPSGYWPSFIGVTGNATANEVLSRLKQLADKETVEEYSLMFQVSKFDVQINELKEQLADEDTIFTDESHIRDLRKKLVDARVKSIEALRNLEAKQARIEKINEILTFFDHKTAGPEKGSRRSASKRNNSTSGSAQEDPPEDPGSRSSARKSDRSTSRSAPSALQEDERPPGSRRSSSKSDRSISGRAQTEQQENKRPPGGRRSAWEKNRSTSRSAHADPPQEISQGSSRGSSNNNWNTLIQTFTHNSRSMSPSSLIRKSPSSLVKNDDNVHPVVISPLTDDMHVTPMRGKRNGAERKTGKTAVRSSNSNKT
jgi:hypothetical protein